MISTMASIGLTTIGRQFVIHFSCAETVDHHGRIICHPAIKNDSSAIPQSGPVGSGNAMDCYLCLPSCTFVCGVVPNYSAVGKRKSDRAAMIFARAHFVNVDR